MKKSKQKLLITKNKDGTVRVYISNSHGTTDINIDVREMRPDEKYWAIREAILDEGWVFTEKMEKLIHKELFLWV